MASKKRKLEDQPGIRQFFTNPRSQGASPSTTELADTAPSSTSSEPLISVPSVSSTVTVEEATDVLTPLTPQATSSQIVALSAPNTSSESDSLDVTDGSRSSHTTVLPLHCIRQEPNQPRNIVFPTDKLKRKFLSKWFDLFNWLEWDPDADNGEGSAFCFACRQGSVRGFLETSKSEAAFSSDGYKNWKKALEKFATHEQSQAHRQMIYKVESFKSGQNVHAKVQTHAEENRIKATKGLHAIFTSLLYLARQGLAIRGKTDERSNFSSLLKLRSDDSENIKKWLDRKITWTSHDIQEEIIELCAVDIMRQLAKKIQSRVFFAVMADETTDITRQEQMSICIRTVSDSLEADEDVLGFHSMEKCDAVTIFMTLKDVLLRFGISITDCRAVCFDGASVFQGVKSGVSSRFQNEEPKIIATHCHMHCVNLAVQATVTNVPLMRDFLLLVQDMINFVRDSPKRCAILKTIAESLGCKQTHVRPLCPTRFTVKYKALQGISNQLEILRDALTEMSNVSSDKAAASHANGFLDKLTNFEFYFSLVLSMQIFELTDTLNTQLQAKNISVNESAKLVEFTINSLTLHRNDEDFCRLWKLSEEKASEMEADPPRLPRQARAPTRYQSSVTHRFETPEDMYRSIYYSVIDNAVNALKDRITSKSIPALKAIESVLLAGWNGDEIPDDSMTVIEGQYVNDLDFRRLRSQLTNLENMRETTNTANSGSMDINQIIHTIGASDLKQMIPQVVVLCKLYLINPATTATAERSFSQLRRLKTYLRNSMTQKRQTHLMILNVFSDMTLDISKLINEFISRDSRRQNTFAPLSS